jgi:hypothetical protein
MMSKDLAAFHGSSGEAADKDDKNPKCITMHIRCIPLPKAQTPSPSRLLTVEGLVAKAVFLKV